MCVCASSRVLNAIVCYCCFRTEIYESVFESVPTDVLARIGVY